ncbi:hypothetical protein BpHYR1_051532 [Brachionus plicatilis]|uniref:Uncharacterized protein n=1 Tax=Brachionus plicatilis TaxID=10195 RepID=A0A3M7R906_BRAPC|nr:hypothetical protein BpHYR1_051532 [Brachionus plicatilis]
MSSLPEVINYLFIYNFSKIELKNSHPLYHLNDQHLQNVRPRLLQQQQYIQKQVTMMNIMPTIIAKNA